MHTTKPAVRTALVTGGTSGLGFAMAQALLKRDVRVAVTGRDLGRTRVVADKLGAGALGIQLEVSDPVSVSVAVTEAWDRLGGIDMVVSNAGLGMRVVNPRFMTDPLPFWKVTPEDFRVVLDSKLFGGFLVTREVVPRMLDRGAGRIVTISMSESTMTRRGFVPYGPSGAAVDAFARIIAADLAETPLRANMLLPGGPTRTGMAPAEGSEGFLDPSVMMAPIEWLASADAARVHDERIVAKDFDEWLRRRGDPR